MTNIAYDMQDIRTAATPIGHVGPNNQLYPLSPSPSALPLGNVAFVNR